MFEQTTILCQTLIPFLEVHEYLRKNQIKFFTVLTILFNTLAEWIYRLKTRQRPLN